MGYNISRFLRAEQLINVKIKTGMNSHVPVFDMQSYWWVWLPGIETPILEPTNISAESSGAEYTVFSFLACLWNQGVRIIEVLLYLFCRCAMKLNAQGECSLQLSILLINWFACI